MKTGPDPVKNGDRDAAGADPETAQAARAYWRLWRRNWRPPFTAEDYPSPGGAEASSSQTQPDAEPSSVPNDSAESSESGQ